MQIAIAAPILALALGLAGCSSAPVISTPVLSHQGEFRGPVVAQRGVPVSARYEGYCEHPPRRWASGSYRAYTLRPCGTERRYATVRALY
jgi:hypothetical protein